jgi:hypothetical protein
MLVHVQELPAFAPSLADVLGLRVDAKRKGQYDKAKNPWTNERR